MTTSELLAPHLSERDRATLRELAERFALETLTRESVNVSLQGADNPTALGEALAERGLEPNAKPSEPAAYLPSWLRGGT